MNKRTLSVIIPVYNEEKTIGKVIETVLEVVNPDQLIVVNDGSTDNTEAAINKYKGYPKTEIVSYAKNRGKGYAMRKGVDSATSEVIIFQDADLELNPEDINKLYAKYLEGGADIINGRREFLEGTTLISRFASKAIPFLVLALFGKYVNDIVCGYKLMAKADFLKLNLKSDRFEIETEIIVKALKQKMKISEMPVSFKPRNRAQGKHVSWRDGVAVSRFLLRERFSR